MDDLYREIRRAFPLVLAREAFGLAKVFPMGEAFYWATILQNRREAR